MASLEMASSIGSFYVEVRPDRARVIVAPAGELDVATAGRVADEIEALVDVGFADLVLDLRELTFMDAAGLRLVLVQARRRDVSVRVINGPPAVARMFDLAGISDPPAFLAPHELARPSRAA
jgi:anti-sigma B factor antagonist